jgi:hypothetical protein
LLRLGKFPARIDPKDGSGLASFVPSFAFGSHDCDFGNAFAGAREAQPSLTFSDWQIIIGFGGASRDFSGFGASTSTGKIDIEFTDIALLLVFLK